MEKKHKRCPRCDRKLRTTDVKCDMCGLVFERLEHATNRAGKVALQNDEQNKVVYITKCNDVNKWRLLVLAIFGGWFGLQYRKVGRNKMFCFMLVSFVMLVIFSAINLVPDISNFVFSNKYLGVLMWLLILPGSIGFMMWIVSVFQILFNKFKIPVSIDEEYIVQDEEVAKELIKQAKANRQSKNIQKN